MALVMGQSAFSVAEDSHPESSMADDSSGVGELCTGTPEPAEVSELGLQGILNTKVVALQHQVAPLLGHDSDG